MTIAITTTSKQSLNETLVIHKEVLEKIGRGENLTQKELGNIAELISFGIVTKSSNQYFLKLPKCTRSNGKKMRVKGDLIATKYEVLKTIYDSEIPTEKQINNYLISFAKFYGLEAAFNLQLVIDRNWNFYICRNIELF